MYQPEIRAQSLENSLRPRYSNDVSKNLLRRKTMRPTPHDGHPPDDSGRIISLGEVRRRRSTRTRAPDRHYLAALALVALVGWAGWIVAVLAIPPARLLTYVAFFTPLWIAVTASGAMAAYGITWQRGLIPSLRACLRRGALAASVVVVNLAVLAAHKWTIILGTVTIAAAIGADVLLSRRSP